jgi:hypothetical protein
MEGELPPAIIAPLWAICARKLYCTSIEGDGFQSIWTRPKEDQEFISQMFNRIWDEVNEINGGEQQGWKLNTVKISHSQLTAGGVWTFHTNTYIKNEFVKKT